MIRTPLRDCNGSSSMLLRNPPPQPIPPSRSQSEAERLSQAFCAIRSVNAASDPCDLLACLCRATQACGVREGAYVHVIPDPERPARVLVMLACDAEQLYEHLRFGTALNHPWLRYARDQIEPALGSMLTDLYRPQEAPMQLGLAFDSLLIVPTHSGGATGRYGALLLDTGHERDGNAQSGLLLLAHSLARELHNWWIRRTRAELQATARLRSDDLKLLAFERQGLPTKLIARTLDTTVDAVDSRFRRINVKLDVANRRHAALRAAINGLL
jgi:DNA-binding CsgD family transcriptional regulator